MKSCTDTNSSFECSKYKIKFRLEVSQE